MESNGNRRAKDDRPDDSARSKEKTPTNAATATVSTASPATVAAKQANAPETPQKSPRKRRKVNHGMLRLSTTACCPVNLSCATCDAITTILLIPPQPPADPHVPTCLPYLLAIPVCHTCLLYIPTCTRSPCTLCRIHGLTNFGGLRAFLQLVYTAVDL